MESLRKMQEEAARDEALMARQRKEAAENDGRVGIIDIEPSLGEAGEYLALAIGEYLGIEEEKIQIKDGRVFCHWEHMFTVKNLYDQWEPLLEILSPGGEDTGYFPERKKGLRALQKYVKGNLGCIKDI